MGQYFDRITITPGQCGGRPCIRGMRVRVAAIEKSGHRAMTCLSDREAKVLTLRLENIMYEDVAKLIGTTRERVRFVEAKAVEKVRAVVAQIRNGGSAC